MTGTISSKSGKDDTEPMLSILHCSDVHLDTPASLSDLGQSDARYADLRVTFASMMQYIRKNGIRLLLIAGDLFNNAHVTPETLDFLKKEFEAADTCHIVIAPGYDDAYLPGSPYAEGGFPKNVHIFHSPKLSCFRIPELNAHVYGFARCGREEHPMPPALDGIRVADRNALNIFCGWADLTGKLPRVPHITREQLARAGFDYAALGSVHNAESLKKVSVNDSSVLYFAYSGALEGRSHDEPGYKCAICGELDKTPGSPASFSVRRMRFCRRHFETAEIDCSDCRFPKDIAGRITGCMVENRWDKETRLRVILRGNVLPDLYADPAAIRQMIPPTADFILCDRTVPDPELLHLSADPTLRGAFYEELRPLLENGSAEEQETARLALRMGLSALNDFRKY